MHAPKILALVIVTAFAVHGVGCSSDSGGGGIGPGFGTGADSGTGGGSDLGAGRGDVGAAPGQDVGRRLDTTPSGSRDVVDGPSLRDAGGASADLGGTPGYDPGGSTTGNDTGGSTTGNDSSGGGGCGNIDFEGVCEGPVLKYCQEGVLATIDCAEDGLSCAFVAEGYGNDCVAASGADCYSENEEGFMLALCSGTDAVCVFTGESSATCRENVKACGSSAYSCSDDVLVLPCDVQDDVQPLGFDCTADGGTCAAAAGDKPARCEGLVEGSVCDSDTFICGDGLVCGDVDPESGVGVCKTGEPPVTGPTCATYCEKVTLSCTGEHAQYADFAACQAYCGIAGGLPAGAEGDSDGNSIACRLHYATAAGSDGGTAAEDCPKAGPSGGGACGSYCDNYCHLVTKSCTGEQKLYDDAEACATACAELSADGTPGDTSGDTVQCRLHFAGAAGSDVEGGSAATHCPNAASAGGELCVDDEPEPVPTYTDDVQPILGAKCASCHTTGGSGGHNGALSYADTQTPSEGYGKCTDEGLLRGACFGVMVHDGSMPPNVGCTGDPEADAENEACLSAEEIETLDAWIAGGMPE